MLPIFIVSDLALMGLTLFFIYRLQLLARQTMYSYRLMSLLGLIIFLLVTFAVNIYSNFTYSRIILDVNEPYIYFNKLFSSFSSFDLWALPVFIVFGLALFASNAVLLWREHYNPANLIGVITGLTLIGLTFFGVQIYEMLSHVMDVHSYLGYHVSLFIENIVHIVVTYLECMMISSFICTVRAARHTPNFDADYAIILGCYAGKGIRLPPLLKRRVDRALSFAMDEQSATERMLTFIPSGGQGSDESMSEGDAMAKYLKRRGIDAAHIIIENHSKNTRQNFQYSKKLIPNRASKVVFSTTGYHVFRSGVIANSVGLPAEGMGAKTKWYFYLNATVREFLAEIASEKYRHILNIVFINISVAIFLIVSYNLQLL